MIATLYGCGLRSYELCALKLSDVDFDRNTVFVKKQKGKQDRFVPLSKHLARGLQKYIRTEKPVIYLFNSQKTDDGKPLPITVRSEEHTSELQSRPHLVCRLLLEKKKKKKKTIPINK